MRFETSEAIAIEDRERVLEALETCLRRVFSQVVRSGDEITLRGLGPSPRAVNLNDETVLRVRTEDGKTIIDADGNFQASAFLGDMSQDAVVREKLDVVFKQVRMQLGLEGTKPLEAAAPEAVSSTEAAWPLQEPAVSTPSLQPPDDIPADAANTDAPNTDAANVAASEAGEVLAEASSIATDEIPMTEGKPSYFEDGLAGSRAPLVAGADVEEGDVSGFSRAPRLADAAVKEDAAAREPMLHRLPVRGTEDDDADEGWADSRAPWIAGAIVALLMSGVGVYVVRFHEQTSAWPWTSRVTQQANSAEIAAAAPPVAAAPVDTPPVDTAAPPSTAAAAPSGVESPVPAADGAAAAGTDSSATPAPNGGQASQTDPSAPATNSVAPDVWLESWAAAMRSRDPVAQASFYADPVDRYIDQRGVSNAALVQEKTADIAHRHGQWTMKLNDVVVENKTASTATVRLVKHYVVETQPAQVSELFVKTRMQLKMVDGQWKIVSEQEIRSPGAAPVNPIDQ